MKILWVFSSFGVGGAQRRFAALAGALGPDMQHVVSAMDDRYEAEALVPPSAWVRLRPIRARKGRLISRANLAEFSRILAEERPDVLVTTNWGAVEWAFAAREAAGHLHCEDGFGPDERADRQALRRVWGRRLAFRRVDAVLVPSRELERVAREVWLVKPHKLRFTPNGVETAHFARAGADRSPAANRPLVVGSVGALRPEKRFDRLLRVFSALAAERDDLRLLLVGDGPERAALEALAAKLGIARLVEFAGAQSEVAPFYARMDAFALTSDTEQAPLALIEAMASGLPAAATEVGDVSAMLSPGNRPYVASADDETGLARRLAALMGDAELRERLGGANAARVAAEYDVSAMAGRWRRIFEEIAPGRRRKRA
ncbi:glycosyltransferase family 4 protein [Neomegalonema perideroedes]|uniref:glycosyltransferase family 4 protein n=1 Tax=Neomegalonema perideroedes TaxID=217219 RepID=UPI0005933071|nr:glycosyltransferase family 4 protein [Neomegalonema perideroedes]